MKTFLAVIAVAFGAVSIAPAAFAEGIGAASGAASFNLTGNEVTGASIAAAVGKQAAYSETSNIYGELSAEALGSAGTILTPGGASDKSDPSLGTAQANGINVNVLDALIVK